MKYNNGCFYSGNWEDNQQSGKGEYTCDDGTKYIGYFKDGKKHG